MFYCAWTCPGWKVPTGMSLPSVAPWWMCTLPLTWFQRYNWYCNFSCCVPHREIFEHLNPTTVLFNKKAKSSNYQIWSWGTKTLGEVRTSSPHPHILCLCSSVTPLAELKEENLSFFAKQRSSPDRKAIRIWDTTLVDKLKRRMREGSLLRSGDCSGRWGLLMNVPRMCLSFSFACSQ